MGDSNYPYASYPYGFLKNSQIFNPQKCEACESVSKRVKELEIENKVLWKALEVTGRVYNFSNTSTIGYVNEHPTP